MPRRLFLFPLLLLAATACERAATDPVAVEEHVAQWSRTAPANTLPALFQDALLTVERRAGDKALRELLSGWERRQARVQAAYAINDAPTLKAELESLRQEELRVVVRALGPSVVQRVLAQSDEALAHARTRITRAAEHGIDVEAAEASTAEASELLARATALIEQQPIKALSLATDAAAQIAAIGDMTVELQRVRTVEELFTDIAADLPAHELRRHARLHGEARAALRDGDRQVASEKLAAVRAEEVRLVLQATKQQACARLLRQLADARSELRPALRARNERGDDVAKLQRMLNTATDLLNRAQQAEAKGDHATALDLGSHAAGLFNSLQHLVAPHASL